MLSGIITVYHLPASLFFSVHILDETKSHSFVEDRRTEQQLFQAKWRRPKGIDSVVRRRFRDQIKLANIGYGTNKKHRHLLPNGFRKFCVANVADLELLLMHNRSYAAEISSGVSVPKRKAILERAAQLNIKVINASAKLRTEENE